MEPAQSPSYKATEKRVVRKLDTHVLPLVSVLYLLSFLDRSNVGNAKTAGMDTDLHFHGSQTYNWLLTIFYISYILFEFLILGWKVVKPHIWCAIVVFGWGIVSTLQAATSNWQGMMVLRFLLGVAEAGYGPGIIFYLTFFYLRHEIGARQGLFLSCAPLATCFAGALAYGITRENGSIESWRLLFIVEGIPTLLMVPVVWFFLPDAPHTCKFLTAEEKEFAASREVRQTGEVQTTGVSWADAKATLLDPKSYLQALMYFSCNTAFGSLPVFMSSFLEESLGFTAINAQGLTAPPYFFSFLITASTPFLADRIQQRGLVIAVLSVIGAIGYVILATVTSDWVRYFGVFLCAGGVFPAIANILPWVTNNQGSDTGRGVAVVLLNLIGQCGPLLGTNVYTSNTAPRYVKGHAVCAAFMFFNAILALTLRTYLSWQNKKLDRQYGTLEEQHTRIALGQVGHDVKKVNVEHIGEPEDEKSKLEGEVAIENYGPMYRYIL